MYGYKLQKPVGIPKTVWACKTTVDHYDWKNRNSSDMIEFSISKASAQTIRINDNDPIIIEGDFFACIVGNERIQSCAADGVAVNIISVCIRFDELCYTAKEFDCDDIKDEDTLLLPCITEGLSKQEKDLFEYLLYRFIGCHMEQNAASDMMCTAIAFELLSRLDRIARGHEVTKKNKYVNYYVAKADTIISNRYSEKLTLRNVARELGITPNYLSAIYKSSIGIGFSEKLYETRMKKASELLLSGELTLFEIAQKVGFDDENHLRRRFKQYFDVSVREYCNINKELTLYHKKPQKKELPDTD